MSVSQACSRVGRTAEYHSRRPLALSNLQQTVAPYGTWSSPITAEIVARAGTRLSGVWLERGTAWWLEGRPAENGRVVLMKAAPRAASPSTPYRPGSTCGRWCTSTEAARTASTRAPSSARTSRISVSIAWTQASSPLRSRRPSRARAHRYADGSVTPDGRLWIGVRERHDAGERSRDVVNELVAIPTDGSGEPTPIAGGRDFYSNPRISPDGARLCFLAWNLPWMPWDGCELFVAELAPDGALGGRHARRRA